MNIDKAKKAWQPTISKSKEGGHAMFHVMPMRKEDLLVVVQIHRECFPEDNSTLEDARDWIEANWRAAPRTTFFVLANDQGQVGGYILWLEQGGFRKRAVLELEQIGVTPSWRGKGGATLLIRESLRAMKEQLEGKGRALKLVKVTTSTSNEAQRLYESFGAVVEAVISDLYEGDEVIMVARSP